MGVNFESLPGLPDWVPDWKNGEEMRVDFDLIFCPILLFREKYRPKNSTEISFVIECFQSYLLTERRVKSNIKLCNLQI